MREKAPDLIGAGFLVVFGVAFAVGAVGYGIFGEGSRVGPGFMPLAASILLIVFGTIIGLQALLGRAPGSRTSAEYELLGESGVGIPTQPETDEETSSRSVIMAFGLTLVAILLIPLLGFLLSFGLLIFVLVTFIEREGWVRGAVLSVVAIGVTWLTFVQLLKIPLPPGIFG